MAAARHRTPLSSSPNRLSRSPTLSAVRTSPLASGLFRPYPPASSLPSSSPVFSFSQPTSSPSPGSPDPFGEFIYCDDMDDDFRRIDEVAASIIGTANTPVSRAGSPQSDDLQDGPQNNPQVHAPVLQDRKVWVVFRGKTPGIYDHWESAIIQTQCFSDGFQRAFSDRASAEAAWIAFTRDGTYPDYGKSPWVVFLGRRPGVFTKITELECSVKGYDGAIFRSCSSVTEGKIKFHRFSEHVAQIFAGPDPFSDVRGSVPHSEEVDDQRMGSTPIPVVAELPLPSQSILKSKDVVESSKSASNGDRARPFPNTSRRVGGWYVAYHAVLPGVYSTLQELKEARPKPGGFRCVLDEDSADMLFYQLALGEEVVWANKDE